jgi:hypothetical protein
MCIVAAIRESIGIIHRGQNYMAKSEIQCYILKQAHPALSSLLCGKIQNEKANP